MPSAQRLLLAWVSAGILASSAVAQPVQPKGKGTLATPDSSGVPQAAAAAPTGNSLRSQRAAMWFQRMFGIDEIHVRYTASGSLLRFSYRVVDAAKAKSLNDKRINPYLVVRGTGEKLEVPETEKVGKLRQTSAPENGREYWMVFTNVGRRVKPGDHVDIVIGTFRADELVVESVSPAPRVERKTQS